MILEELRVDLPGEKQDTASIEQKVNDEATEAEYERRTAGMSAEAAAAIAVEISDTRKQVEFERERKDSELGPQRPG